MNKLPNIDLTKDEYEYFLNTNTPYFGTEANLIPYKDKYMIKFFKRSSDDDFQFLIENKFNKIKTIAALDNFDNEIVPLCTYSYNGNFVGYLMPKMVYPLLDHYCLTATEKIECLKLIKQKLIYFHEFEIIYGDIKEDNIFYDKERKLITFGDIDNVLIQQYPIDVMHQLVKDFIRRYKSIDEKLDSYVMNLLTIDLLNPSSKWYYGILDNINSLVLPADIATDRNYRLVKEMSHITSSYSGGYLIDDTN